MSDSDSDSVSELVTLFSLSSLSWVCSCYMYLSYVCCLFARDSIMWLFLQWLHFVNEVWNRKWSEWLSWFRLSISWCAIQGVEMSQLPVMNETIPFSFLHWWDVLTFMNIFGCVRVQGCYDLWMCAGRWLVMYCLSRQWYFPDYIGCVICLPFCPSIVNCFLLWFYTVCCDFVIRPSVGWYRRVILVVLFSFYTVLF